MAKLTLNDVTNLNNQTSSQNTINGNSRSIEAALEKTLSRDGTSPNQMGTDLDMNGLHILNSPAPVQPTHLIRKLELDAVIPDINSVANSALTSIATAGTNAVNTVNSAGAAAVGNIAASVAAAAISATNSANSASASAGSAASANTSATNAATSAANSSSSASASAASASSAASSATDAAAVLAGLNAGASNLTGGTSGQIATKRSNADYDFYWTNPATGTGSVSSVAISVPTGFSASGTPITTTGTLEISYASGYQGYTTTEATKLGAMATNAQLRDRSTHTGEQAVSTITGLQDVLGLFYKTKALATAASIPVVSSSVYILGYTAEGDGGAGRYLRVGSEPSHAGKFKDALNNWWALDMTNGVCPEQFGNPAATNHTTAFQAAIDACLNVKLQIRDYKITSELVLRSNQRIVGAGRSLSSISATGCGGFISGASNEKVSIEDLSIIGDQTASKKGIYALNNPRGFSLQRLYIYGFGSSTDGAGVVLDGTTSYDMWGATLDQVNVEGSGIGIELIKTASTVLLNCISRLNKGSPLYADGFDGLTILGGAYENSNAATGATYSSAMYLANGRGMSCQGTYMENVMQSLVTLENCRWSNFSGIFAQIAESTNAELIKLISGSTLNTFENWMLDGLYNATKTAISISSGCNRNTFKNITIESDNSAFAGSTFIADNGKRNTFDNVIYNGTPIPNFPVTFSKINTTSSLAIDWEDGNEQIITVQTNNVTSITFSNPRPGVDLILHIRKNGFAYTIAGWPSSVLFAGGSAGDTVTADKVDTRVFRYLTLTGKYQETSRALNKGW